MSVEKYMDITFRLGHNAKENWSLIDDADPNDWWFHLDNGPSAHCIVEVNELNSPLIYHASSLILQRAKMVKGTIIFTQVKNLQKGKAMGSVVIKGEINKVKINLV